MQPVWIGVLSFLGVVATAGVTYLVARRVHGGTVRSADADTIFKAAEELREEQRQEIQQLRQDVTAQHTEILSLRSEIGSLRAEITSLRAESARLRAEADHLRAEAAVSKSEAAVLRRKVAEQEAAMSAVQREIAGAVIVAREEST